MDRPIVETARLVLRRPDDGDVRSILALVGDWEVARRLARVPHPYTDDDARFFLDVIVPREWVWAITYRKSKDLVGMVGLTPGIDRCVAELGYYVDRQHWGRGLATEAAAAVVRYGLDSIGLRTIMSGYFADNPASGRVLSKLGFVETARAERECLALGKSLPLVEMRLRAHEEIWTGTARGG